MKNITVSPKITIRQAMGILDKTADKCLLVVDDHKKLLGTLTDGDLRRSVLGGAKFNDVISNSYNIKPTVLFQNKYNIEEAKRLLRDLKLYLIPVLDEKSLVVDYLTWSSIGGKSKLKKSVGNVPVVIMAGGKGERMKPFTKVLPKPLIPVHNKTILEHIIESFTKVGCSDFYLNVNYKSKIIKAYFEELEPNYNVSFIEEKTPLGTAGSLKYLKGEFSQPFFLTNCDIIIKADYSELYKFHQKGKYDLTLVASAKEYIIPYGTCELNSEGHLSHINEKPKYDFFINTGLYVLNPDMLKLIKKNKIYHITHLIEDARSKGKKVGVFPVDDNAWFDVGEWAAYRETIQKLEL